MPAGLEEPGVHFQITDNGLTAKGSTGKLVLHIIGAIAEFERSFILERARSCSPRPASASGRSERMAYFAFDLLYLDGSGTRRSSSARRVLAALLSEANSAQLSQLSRPSRRSSTSRPAPCAWKALSASSATRLLGSSAIWLKILCVAREVFPIAGFIAAGDGIAALHLARRRGKELD